jgi:hypothetical protein
MRKTLIVITLLTLAGCVKQSASYYVSDARDHAISVRAEQEYVWDQHITLTVIAARFPDCQRAFELEKVNAPDVTVELFSSGENVFTIRSGAELKQFEMQNCAALPVPAPNAIGEAVGVFRLGEGEKMEFTPATPAPAPAPAS